jgi:hypothetical protein
VVKAQGLGSQGPNTPQGRLTEEISWRALAITSAPHLCTLTPMMQPHSLPPPEFSPSPSLTRFLPSSHQLTASLGPAAVLLYQGVWLELRAGRQCGHVSRICGLRIMHFFDLRANPWVSSVAHYRGSVYPMEFCAYVEVNSGGPAYGTQ